MGIRTRKIGKIARNDFCPRDLRDKLLSEAPTESIAIVLHLGFLAGLRKCEIMEARWNWIDFDSGTIGVQNTGLLNNKNRKIRIIPLCETLRRFLLTIQKTDGYILELDFPIGRASYQKNFRKPFKDYMEKEGCSWVTPHTLRRTFASLLVSSNVSISKVALWMGNSLELSQELYGHLESQEGETNKLG